MSKKMREMKKKIRNRIIADKQIIHVARCLKNDIPEYSGAEYRLYNVTFDQPKRIRDRIKQ